MFDEPDPRRLHDDEPEFEKLEFLPEEDTMTNEEGPGQTLTFDLPDTALEPPVTVDPQAALPEDAPALPAEESDAVIGTPFELLGSSLLDRFAAPDDSLDWAFDFEEDDADDLDG